MTKPTYSTTARVVGGRAGGRGAITTGELAVELQMPKELGGPGGATNPEQLLAIGYAACFETVLGMLAPHMHVTAEDAVIHATVGLIPAEHGRFELGVELDVSLPSVADPQRAAALVRKAHQTCPYSRALRGNVEVALTVNGARLRD